MFNIADLLSKKNLNLWSERGESNTRRHGPKPCGMPLAYAPIMLVQTLVQSWCNACREPDIDRREGQSDFRRAA
jgi:hypothetical protein